MSRRTWNPHPLSLAILDSLQKKGGLSDVDLLEEMKDSYGDVSFRELNKALLKLEVTGIVNVSRLMKSKRQVELVNKDT